MATTLKDSVIHWRKKIERCIDDDETILNVIRKLSKIPITIELLQETHIGKVVRGLSKKEGAVGDRALSVLKKWRDIYAKTEQEKLKSSKHSGTSRKENVLKESSSNKSSTKHSVNQEKSHHKKTSHNEHKQKSHGSVLHKAHSSEAYMNGNCSANISKESNSSLYTYVKQEPQAKYMDYDPNADINEGYNPECPELYPGSKSLKVKSESFTDTYEPSSVKHKSSSEEKTNAKHKHKKLKTENSSPESSHTHKVEKHSIHKDKGKDSKLHASAKPKKESSDQKQLVKESSKHKSTSESKKHKSKDSSGKKNSSSSNASKEKIKITCSEGFTSSEVRFEDCLGFNDIVTIKKKKTVKPQPSSIKSSTSKSVSSSKKPLNDSHKTTSSSSVNRGEKVSTKSLKQERLHAAVPKPSVKLEEVDIVSTLPQTIPTYRPLPQPRSPESYASKRKVMTNEEAIMFTSSRKEKTAVYSGRKSHYTEVPTLFEFCTQKLIENIDAIEFMGGVPYFLIKPVLERCNAHQLFSIENFNPYLLDDTPYLWEMHCKRDFKLLKPQENETWRELYERAYEERERKLRSITANICASMSKSNPVRQVKLAYVDSVAKPPRDVARRQAKNGTALPVNHPMKTGPPSKASPKPIAPVINAAATASASAASSVSAPTAFPKAKPKVAPLMAKTLKSMKMCFRR